MGNMLEEKRNPFSLFMSGVEADVLHVLSRTWYRHSALGIAKLCGRSRNQVYEVLTMLADNKIVAAMNHGNQKSFVLNLHSPLYTYIRAIGAMKLVRGVPDEEEETDDYQEH